MLLSGLAIDIGQPRVEELEGYQDHGLRQSGKIEDSAWFLIALKRLVSIYLNLHLSSFLIEIQRFYDVYCISS